MPSQHREKLALRYIECIKKLCKSHYNRRIIKLTMAQMISLGKVGGSARKKYTVENECNSRSFAEFKVLMQNMAGGHSIDALLSDARFIKMHLRNDKRLREILERFARCTSDILGISDDSDGIQAKIAGKSPQINHAHTQGCLIDDLSDLIARVRTHSQHALYASHFVWFFAELTSFLHSLLEDKETSHFAKAYSNVVDLCFKKRVIRNEDHFTLRPVVLRDLVTVILPGFLRKLTNFVIPTIGYDGIAWDITLHSFVINIPNICPSKVKFSITETIDLLLPKTASPIDSNFSKTIVLSCKDIGYTIENMNFTLLSKKYSFISDTGTVKVHATDFELKLKFEYLPNDPNQSLVVREVSWNKGKFNLGFTKVYHS